MSVSYDLFTEAFLSKVTEYEFMQLTEDDRTATVDTYMKRAFSAFRKNCKYDFATTGDSELREFDVDVPDDDLIEIIDIVSEGMLVEWMKPYTYRQELLENAINTRDYSLYSPAELLRRVGSAYAAVQKDFIQKIREYSYNHGALTELHL